MENEQLELSYVDEIIILLKTERNNDKLKEKIEDYHESDIADAFEKLTRKERRRLYKILGVDKTSEIFAYLEDVEKYVRELDLDYVAKIVENMDADDAVDVLEEVSDEERDKLIHLLDKESREDIELIQSYDEDEIGSLMTTSFIEINKQMSVKEAMKALTAQAEDCDNLMTLYVVDEDEKFIGAVDLNDLLRARATSSLDEIIQENYPFVLDHDEISEKIEQIKDYAEDSIPVLDEDDHMLGIITATDLVEVVDDELGEDYAKLAGLTEEEDLDERTIDSMKKRLPWLIILFFLGMGVSTVVGLFEHVVAEITIIMSFQSLILGMAGNVGTQSLGVSIRVLMDEDLNSKKRARLILKELRIGIFNGLFLACMAFILIGLYLTLLKSYDLEYAFSVSACAGIAIIIAMTISSLNGTLIPLFFQAIHIDPAIASGPLISTMNDLIAAVTYYGMAWLLLLNILHLA